MIGPGLLEGPLGLRPFGSMLAAGAGGAAVEYLLRDEFITDRAAGAANGTAAEPGPGVRDVVDTDGNSVAISGGKATITGNAAWDQTVLQYPTEIVREPGRVLIMDFMHNNQLCAFGFKTLSTASFGGYNNTGFYREVSGSWLTARRTTSGGSPRIWATTNTVTFTLFVVLRNAGRYVFLKAAGIIRLLWIDEWDSSSPLYVGANGNSAALSEWDNIRVPISYFSVIPDASDSFNRADGVIGSTDGAGHTEANGGSGVAWVNQEGVYTTASNAAASSTLASGVAITTIETGANEVLRVKTTRGGGNVGVVLRYVDASNYIIAYHDGTNAKLDKVVAGVTTNVISAVSTYAAGAYLMAVADGAAVWLYYNEIYIGNGTVSDAALQSSTTHGLYSTDASNTFDDFAAFARRGYADLEEF